MQRKLLKKLSQNHPVQNGKKISAYVILGAIAVVGGGGLYIHRRNQIKKLTTALKTTSSEKLVNKNKKKLLTIKFVLAKLILRGMKTP